MKGCAIVKLDLGEIDEIFDMPWGVIGEKSKLNLPKLGRDRGFRVFSSEIEVLKSLTQ